MNMPPGASFSSRLTCLTGPRSCGKTSLLFQHALTCSQRGHRVMYICPKPPSRLPIYQTEPEDHTIPHSEILERITFRYPSTLAALQEVFDNLHLNEAGLWHKEKLGCIIVDDLHLYFSKSSPAAKVHDVTTQASQICAHLLDAAQCASTDGEASVKCIVALLKRSLAVPAIQKWIPTVLQVNEVGSGAYDLTLQQPHSQDKLSSYTIHEDYIEFH